MLAVTDLVTGKGKGFSSTDKEFQLWSVKVRALKVSLETRQKNSGGIKQHEQRTESMLLSWPPPRTSSAQHGQVLAACTLDNVLIKKEKSLNSRVWLQGQEKSTATMVSYTDCVALRPETLNYVFLPPPSCLLCAYKQEPGSMSGVQIDFLSQIKL